MTLPNPLETGLAELYQGLFFGLLLGIACFGLLSLHMRASFAQPGQGSVVHRTAVHNYVHPHTKPLSFEPAISSTTTVLRRVLALGATVTPTKTKTKSLFDE